MNGPDPARPARDPVRAALQGLLHAALLRGLRPGRMPHDPPMAMRRVVDRPLQSLRVQGARGQRLHTWLALPQGAGPHRPAPVVVALHGWGAHASTLWPVVEPLVAAGLAVALFDAANHGDSSAEDFSSLPRFSEDLDAVVDAVRTRPGVDAARVALLGHSVGAAAVLMHAATHGGVRAVASLSAFAHPREVMERWLREHRIPRRWPGAAVLEHVQSTIGHRFDAIAPVRLAARVDCPVLLVHGALDATVPLQDARRLQAALPRAELIVVHAGHDLREALVPQAARLVDFLRHQLAPGS